MDDLLSEFLTETAENLSVLDVELVRLEQNPNDPNLLGNIFRLVHTIKGTCGFLGLPRLEAVAHAAENVLGKFRDGELEVTPHAVTLILQSLDRIKEIVAVLEATEAEPEGDDAELIAALDAMAEGRMVKPPAAAAPAAAAEPDQAPVGGDVADPLFQIERPLKADEVSLEDLEAAFRAAPGPDQAASAPETRPADSAEDEVIASTPATPTDAERQNASVRSEELGDTKESAVASQSIRVNVDLLENLMTTVSELVLTRNQLLQILRSQKDSEFSAPLQRLNHVTSELQEGVMKTRMQPIGNAWAKLPRIIRDLSNELGKKIDLQMVGADTELDRQVLDLIKDPLTHMVRNSADHGIELPSDRAMMGKPEHGTIRLNAFHEGGHIIIEIADDGRGLPTEKIRRKVLEQGLATEAELAGMSDQQIQHFVFKPGFSTAAKVTNVSGRGVGMDVVRTNIEKIGGTIDLTSTEGRGSVFTIKIPLTLAIVSALVVESAGERFAIPQISVVELVRAGGQSEHAVERINGTPVLRLRDRLLPLVSLRKLLKIESADEAESQVGGDRSDSFIVVTQVGSYTFGILVDRVFDTEEIVVKPVAPILRHIEMFSGNTILGDGSVIMILDPNGIASATGEITLGDDLANQEAKQQRAQVGDQVSMLLFRAGSGAPKAVPLALIARLEDIDVSTIEASDQDMVVQYRGRLMPLIPFDHGFYLPEVPEGETARKPVLVFADNDRSMGLIVDEIVDIVETELKVEMAAERPGLLGSAVIAGKATDVIDAGHYLTQAYHDWFGRAKETFEEDDAIEALKRVLLVDDSPFFRNMLTPLLKIAGYDVHTVDSASEALSLCEAGERFDVIVSDIEMPGMNGFDFAEKVKTDGPWQDTPMVALSSFSSQRDLERGRAAGFTDYVAKFDRDALLNTLSHTLADERGAA